MMNWNERKNFQNKMQNERRVLLDLEDALHARDARQSSKTHQTI